MSATAPPRADAEQQTDSTCVQCGAPLAEGQEWCLECGGARTLIHRPADWRIPLALIGIVIAGALAAFVVALVNLSSDANQHSALASANTPRSATPRPPATTPATVTPSQITTTAGSGQATAHAGQTTATAGQTTPTTTTTSTTTPASATTLTTPTGARLESWPPGLSGWTVVLSASRSEATADAAAQRIAATGIEVGVLNSSAHPKLTPGFWLVFSGRYATQGQALAVAGALVSAGHSTAQARLVALPGQ